MSHKLDIENISIPLDEKEIKIGKISLEINMDQDDFQRWMDAVMVCFDQLNKQEQ